MLGPETTFWDIIMYPYHIIAVYLFFKLLSPDVGLILVIYLVVKYECILSVTITTIR